MLSDRNIASARTVAPAVAGAVAAWLLSKGIAIDSTTLLLVVFPILVGVWHRAVLVLEARWPWLGVLLGVPKAPTYSPPSDPK